MKKSIFFALLSIFAIGLQAQNFWVHLTKADGLVSNSVNDILIENRNSIWIATDTGLSHYDGIGFTNFTSSNSALNNNRISELEMANGKLYMITAVGMSELNNNQITNYSTSNGLPNNTIRGIASSSNGDLWIGTTTGLSRFDGNTFFTDPSKTAYDIEVDSSDRVYILRFSSVFNIPGFPQAVYEVYDGNNWSTPPMGPFTETFNNPKLHRNRNGIMTLSSPNTGYFAKLSYPFNLEIVNPEVQSVKFQFIKDIEFQSNGQEWLAGVNAGDNNLFLGSDSLFASMNLVPFGLDHKCIDAHDGVVVSGSNQGIFLANDNIQPTIGQAEININSIRTGINIDGPLFMNTKSNTANFEFPAGNNSYGIFAANLIVASKSITDPNYVVNPINTYSNSMRPGPVSPGPVPNVNYIVQISKSEIDQHKLNYASPGYTMPLSIQSWPANGDTSLGIAADLAPFFDVNGNGCYDPANGDYPAILGDQAIYWINNPILNLNHLEYHGMLYGYNSSNPALDQTLFLKYRIINRSNRMLDSVKVGFFMDADVGNSADDYVGCDSIHNISYAYNGDPFDNNANGRNGYGSNPPAVGVIFLSDSMDSHLYYNIGSGQNGDPSTGGDWANYLDGKWKNGNSATYGGDGFNSLGTTSIPSRFMYTGDPYLKTGWTEENPAPGVLANFPGDRRSISSMPYFSLAAGADRTLDFAIGYGMKDSTSQFAENVPEMISVLTSAKILYQGFNYSGFSYASNTNCLVTGLSEAKADLASVSMYPNPSKGQLRFESETGIQQIEVYDMKGSQLKRATYPNQKQLDFNFPEQVKGGLYFIRLLDAKNNWHTEKIILQR